MAIGEVGSITRGNFGANEDVRIDFSQPIDDPVIMLTGSNGGGDEYSLVITSIDANGFTFRVDEFENHDGPHPATEQINWIAVEEGVHILPDGRVIEAGITTATTTPSNVDFNANFTSPPVVLTNRASENDPDVSDSDPFNITQNGFDVQLQEGPGGSGVNTGEDVHYIAITPGGDASSGTASTANNLTTGFQLFDLGDTFADGISFAETQTLNEADTGNVHINRGDPSNTDEINLRFDEADGYAGGNAHAPETVGIVTFENGIIPCYAAGTKITTNRGSVDVSALAPGDMILTRDNGFQPLKWLCATTLGAARLRAEPDLAPIHIQAGAIAPGVPCDDMWVSPQHRMLITGWRAELLAGDAEVLVPARALKNGTTITQPGALKVQYFHLMMDQHEVIYAQGAPSESLYARELALTEITDQRRSELIRLFPDLPSGSQGATARQCLTVRQGRAFAA
ncbi:MAG: Hint domain-containing protein [Pseudomonadota bacterium]